MRVLLVYSNQCKDLTLAPPVGLSYIASAAELDGHKIKFLDLLIADKPHELLQETMGKFMPNVVGISVRNIDNVVCQRTQNHLKELSKFLTIIRQSTNPISNEKIQVVLGGPAISILEEMSLQHLDADFAICGEGEKSFPALLAALENQTDYYKIPGLCYRRGEKILKNPREILGDFGSSGMEKWVDWHSYHTKGNACWAIQTKRGCPMKCEYCAYPSIEGQRFRIRSTMEVVDEIETVIKKVGPRTFEFVDSTFNAPQSHAIELCEEIIRRKLKANFTAMGVNPISTSRELFSVMKRAGFNSMMVTPEAANNSMLSSYNKGFEIEAVYETANLIRECGIHSTWFFMLGGPGETQDTVNETITFVENELNDKQILSIFMVGIRIMPGTGIARTAYNEGYLRPDANLAEPTFYISPKVTEKWMIQRINKAVQKQANIVLAADEGQSSIELAMYKGLRLFGVAPPYWRFLPKMLNISLLHSLRKHNLKKNGYTYPLLTHAAYRK